ITAEGVGTTKIIAKYKGKKYICKITVTEAADDPVDEPGEDETQRRMLLTIDGARLDVEWESNDSVEALKKLLTINISISEYGGFEQVGDLGTTLPRSDERITTAAGDIVLYNGDEISVFYDSNSWSYTRLGRITGKSKADLRELLEKDNVTAELSFEEEASKTMVVYFSQTGSTKGVAEKIADITEAELQRIEPEIPYTEEDLNYNDSSSRATREQNDLSQRPGIKNEITLAGCRTLYLGYPIWWGQAPRIMDTFVEGHDFTGITVIPFCTSGSSGIGKSAKRLEELAGSGTWKAGNRFSANASLEELTEWVGKQK
ncbi:MAG: hypothetical protein IJT05_07325, partial [Lachnospiraceae bacterium]|nr:hypothetical protein [Lachnospiraceae bacterium]